MPRKPELKQKAIILDFDGTLVNSYEHLHRGIIKGMEKHSRLRGEDLERWKKDFTLFKFWERMNWDTFVREAHEHAGIKLTSAELDELRKKIETSEDEEVHGAELYKDVKQFLNEIKKHNITLAISSFSNERRLVERLREEGLLKHFDEELIHGREHSRDRTQRLKLLLDKLKARGIKPEECLLIGDMPSDVLAGKKNGVPVIIVRRKIKDKYIIPKISFIKRNAQPMAFVDSLIEVLEKFK